MKNSTTTRRLITLLSIFALAFGALSLTGCSEDDDDSSGWGDGPDPDEPDADDDDADVDEPDPRQNQEEDPCHGVTCSEGEVCVEGDCVAETSHGYGCADPYDLGTLSGAQEVSQLADPRQEENVVTAECATSDSDSPQAVFRFDVDEPVAVNLDLEQTFDESLAVLNQDIREGSCMSMDSSIECETEPQAVFAEPGNDYYVIVEARSGQDIGEFELTVNTETTACFPVNETSCGDGELVYCHGGEEERFYSCAGDCIEQSGDDVCAGDHCSAPIEVTESQTITADMTAYSDELNVLHPDTGCVPDNDEFSEYGRDLVFKLPGLEEGTTVELTPPADPRFVVGVMEQCSEMAPECLVADDTNEGLDWEVPSAGDYYVVFHQNTTAEGEVEFDINID